MNKLQRLALFLSCSGQPDYRLTQIIRGIFVQKEIDFAKMFFCPNS
jgi:adenine C2-methylase RlmN of 23S rRNA A2503 and tRNA A37